MRARRCKHAKYCERCRRDRNFLKVAICQVALRLKGNTSGTQNTATGYLSLNSNTLGESETIRIGNLQTQTFIAGIRGRSTGINNAIPVLIDSGGQLGTQNSSRRFKKEIKPMDQTSQASERDGA